MSQSILRDTVFKDDANGHGGNRRTAQLAELAQKANLQIIDIKPDGLVHQSSQRLHNYVKGVQFIAKHHFKLLPLPRLIQLCGHQSGLTRKTLAAYSGQKVLLWEATRNPISLLVAKEYNFKVIAAPHNLEALLVNQKDIFTRRTFPGNLEDECQRLAQADAVFCISREEQWLLKSFGIHADYLPYYPPQDIYQNLLQVRAARTQSEKNKFLILGTALNTPTRLGIVNQLQLLQQLDTVAFEVDIVGFGTERLRESVTDQRFTLQGSVEVEQLNQLLISCKAVLLHQLSGAGALTRIPELLIAGVPIIANSHACRSAHGYQGVYCYDSAAELADLLTHSLPIPDRPARPMTAEARFMDCIQTALPLPAQS